MLFVSFSTSLTDFFQINFRLIFIASSLMNCFFTKTVKILELYSICKHAVEELTSFQCAVFMQSLSTDYTFITFVKFLHLDFKQFGLK